MSKSNNKRGWVPIEVKRWTGKDWERWVIPPRIGVLLPLPRTEKPLAALKDRRFLRVKPKGIDEFLNKVKPVVSFSVPNTLANNDTKLPIKLTIHDMASLKPINVAKQIEPLQQLLEVREALVSLRAYLDGNDQLEGWLRTFMQQGEMLRQRRKEIPTVKQEGQNGQHSAE